MGAHGVGPHTFAAYAAELRRAAPSLWTPLAEGGRVVVTEFGRSLCAKVAASIGIFDSITLPALFFGGRVVVTEFGRSLFAKVAASIGWPRVGGRGALKGRRLLEFTSTGVLPHKEKRHAYGGARRFVAGRRPVRGL